MKQRTLATLLIIETAPLALMLIGQHTNEDKNIQNSEKDDISILWNVLEETEIFREESPDCNFVVYIEEIAPPTFPFGDAHLQVTLFEVITEDERPGRYYRASFKADVANDGASASYEIEWLEDGLQIALIGSEQPTAYYILPFRTINSKETTCATAMQEVS